jgi:Chaperone of endosialidase
MDGAAAVGAVSKYAREDHVHPTDTSRVAKAGDTMTGDLLFDNGTADSPGIRFTQLGFSPWMIDYEGGALRYTVGANIFAAFYSSNGVLALGSTAAATSPTTGALRVAGGVGISGNAYVGLALGVSGGVTVGGEVWTGNGSTTGVLRFGNSVSQYLYFDGSKFSISGGPLQVAGQFTIQNSALVVATGAMNVGYISPYGIMLRPSTDSGAVPIVFTNAASTICGQISTTATTTTYATSSDDRLKDGFEEFDAGRIVDDTAVYSFRWKTTGERSYGVSAQEANEVYPAAVTYDKTQDWYGIDYSKYVPILLNELKALRARVAELEVAAGLRPPIVGVEPA